MSVRFGVYELDLDRRQLASGGHEIPLPARTLRFLELLLDVRPRAVSKEELTKQLWPGVEAEESHLKTIVSELRAALDDADRSLIRTVKRYGYAFAGEAVSDDEPPGRTYVLCCDNFRVSVSRAVAVIGSHPGCDIWIDSPDVSRSHARISVGPEQILVEDLGSKSGTRVGTRQISEPTELHDGDRLSVGGVTLLFRTASDDEREATA
ncbi:MAG TPA: FHA domain-containing protein [Thermoanaerobaculia bacterium]